MVLDREPTRTRAVLSKEEFARLFDCCDPHFRPLALAAYYSGQRPQELLALKWADVSFGNRTLAVFRRKVGLGDSIPLHPALAAALKALKEKRAKDASAWSPTTSTCSSLLVASVPASTTGRAGSARSSAPGSTVGRA